MSTIDQPRPLAPRWNRLGQEVVSGASLVAGRAIDSCATLMRLLRANRPLWVALFSAVAAWVILQVLFEPSSASSETSLRTRFE